MAFKAIYFNSAQRDGGGAPEDFTITDNAMQFTYPPKTVKMTYVAIPFSWNNITSSNNQVELIEQPNAGATATVPVGNYTGTTLAAALQVALDTASTHAYTYTVTYNAASLEFTIASTGNFSLDFVPTNSIAPRLGYVVGTTTPEGMSTTSVRTALIQSDTEIWVCSDLVGGCDNGFVNFTPGEAANNQILAVVPINTTYGNTIYYTSNPDNPFFVTTQSNFGKVFDPSDQMVREIGFFLQFPSGFNLSLNGMNWSGTLTFGFV